MTNRTHRLVSGSGAFMALVAVGVEPYLAVSAGLVAAVSAPLPDKVEKPLRLSHRGPSHWPVMQAIVLSMPVIAVWLWLPIALLYVGALAFSIWMGCVVHSLADAMTVAPGGIKLLWPFFYRGFHLLPRFARVWVGRDSRSEKVFVLAWCAFVLYFLYARYRSYIPA